MREALAAVGLLDEILRLPAGLNTDAANPRAALTTSQAARLMVARAIVGRPRLLLVDGTLGRACPNGLLRLPAGQHDPPGRSLDAAGRHDRRDVLAACIAWSRWGMAGTGEAWVFCRLG